MLNGGGQNTRGIDMNTAQTIWLWIMNTVLAAVSFLVGLYSDTGPFTALFIFMIPFALLGIAFFKTLGPSAKEQQKARKDRDETQGGVLHRVEQLVSAAIPDEDKKKE